jgi:hypothetical protein
MGINSFSNVKLTVYEKASFLQDCCEVLRSPEIPKKRRVLFQLFFIRRSDTMVNDFIFYKHVFLDTGTMIILKY